MLVFLENFAYVLNEWSRISFKICLWRWFSPPIFNINLLPRFIMVGNFSGGYSRTDCNFNFNISIIVDSYMNSCFNFSFSHLLKYLFAFKIMKLGSTSKITTQFEAIPQCLLFVLIILLYIFEKQAWHEAYVYFLIAFVCLYSLTGSNSIFYIRFHLYFRWTS